MKKVIKKKLSSRSSRPRVSPKQDKSTIRIISLSILGLLLFFAIAATLPIKDNVFKALYTKLFSHASTANSIQNPSFETDLSSWGLGVQSDSGGTAVATMSQDLTTAADGNASDKITITTTGPTNNYVQLNQSGLPLTSGQVYTVTFWAKSDVSGRQIRAGTQLGQSPWTTYSDQVFTLTTAWQQYTYTYSQPATDSNGTILFSVGQQTGNVWFDNVSLTQGSLTSDPVHGNILWAGDFETNDFSQWWSGTQVHAGGVWGNSAIDIVSAPDHVIQGLHSARFTLNGAGTTNHVRAELSASQANTGGYDGQDWYYSWSTYAPSNPNATTGWDNNWNLIAEWSPMNFPNLANCSPAIGMLIRVNSGVPHIVFNRNDQTITGNTCGPYTTQQDYDMGQLVYDQWINTTVHIKFSTDPNVGYVEAWNNGVQVIPHTPMRTELQTAGAYFEQDVYRPDFTAGAQNIIYYDGMIRHDAYHPNGAPTPTPTSVVVTNTPTPIPTSTPAPAVNVVKNASFETTGSNWLNPWGLIMRSDSGGSATGTVVRDTSTKEAGVASAKITITKAAPAAYYAQLYQDNLALTGNKKYVVSFWAKSNVSGKQIDVQTQQAYSPWNGYSYQTFTLSSSWKQYSYTYTQSVSDSNSELNFGLGLKTGTVWIDNVSLK